MNTENIPEKPPKYWVAPKTDRHQWRDLFPKVCSTLESEATSMLEQLLSKHNLVSRYARSVQHVFSTTKDEAVYAIAGVFPMGSRVSEAVSLHEKRIMDSH